MNPLNVRKTVRSAVAFLALTLIAAAFAQEVTVVFPGTSEAERAWAERAAAAIEETNPDIELDLQFIGWGDLTSQLLPRIRAGNPPDITMQQDFANFQALGALEPLGPYLERPGDDVSADTFVESVLDYSRLDGELYTLPAVGIGYGLVVRSDLLEEAGYSAEDLTSWDDLLEAAEALTVDEDGDGNPDQYGFVYPTGAPRFAWRHAYIMAYSNGFSLLDFAERDKYVELLSFIEDLSEFSPAGAQAMDLAEAFNAVSFGRAAMMATGSFYVANVYSIDPEVVQVSTARSFPQGPSVEDPWVPVSNAGWAMFSGSENKDAAWEVMAMLASRELGGEYSAFINVPARTDVTDEQIAATADELYPEAPEANRRIVSEFFDAVEEFGRPIEKIAGREAMERVFTEQINALIDGSKTPEEVYETLRDRISDIQEEQEEEE